MTRKRILAFACWLLRSCLLVIGCSQTNRSNSTLNTSPTTQTTLTMSAAASLKDALEEIKPIYTNVFENQGFLVA